MPTLFLRHYGEIKWFAEYTMLPLHFLALAHYHTLAVAIGAAIFIVYSIASLQLARAEKSRDESFSCESQH